MPPPALPGPSPSAGRSGLGTIDHEVPSHSSVNVTPQPSERGRTDPTAMQKLAAAHDTP
ncbi:MAG TPA: hypothetical protein VMD59_19210 [Acidimicrobiales bacterium]|nr:hypothetical protein [Acidimicrobiales bacterium]